MPSRAAQLARRDHIQIQAAVGGHHPEIAAGRCLHLGAVENLLDQRHSSASFQESQSLAAFELTVVRSLFRFGSESASTRAGAAGIR
jgi:hypothetical protein